MSTLFGGYRMQVHHEVAQRIALALQGTVANDHHAVLVALPEDGKVSNVLQDVPGVVCCAVAEDSEHAYVRRVTVKRPKRNAVRFVVMRERRGDGHSYVIRSIGAV